MGSPAFSWLGSGSKDAAGPREKLDEARVTSCNEHGLKLRLRLLPRHLEWILSVLFLDLEISLTHSPMGYLIIHRLRAEPIDVD